MKWRCPQCRTRRSTEALMVAHQAKHKHYHCLCPGPAFLHDVGKHRPFTAGCYLRDDLQRSADAAWDTPGEPTTEKEPPF